MAVTHDPVEWQRRVLTVRAQIDAERELYAQQAAAKSLPWDADARMRQLYCELELLRMDFCELPEVFSVLRRKEHSERDGKGPSSIPSSVVSTPAPSAPSSVKSVSPAEADEGDHHDHPESEQHEALEHAEAEVRHEERRKSVSEAPPATEVPEEDIDHIMKLFDDTRALCSINKKKKKSPIQALRFLVALLYFLVWTPVFFILSPLRLLHPTLRNFGVHNNFLPIDLLQMFFARGFLTLFGIRVFVEGSENVDLDHNAVAMFSHASNLDPIIVASGHLAFKWIGKKILFRIPVMGWLFNLYGHIGIDRGNKANAIASLDEAVKRIHKWGRSIAISPEGTRSKSGRLLDFKKGPFHLAKQVNLPVVPICIIGAYELWPSGQLFLEPGDVTIRFLPTIRIEPTDDYNSLASRVRRAMLKGLSGPRDPPAPEPAAPNAPAVPAEPLKEKLDDAPKYRRPYIGPIGTFFGKYFPALFYAAMFLFYLRVKSISKH